MPTQPPLVFLDDNAASSARAALEEFTETLTQNFAAYVEAQPEDQLKGPTQTLLRELGRVLDLGVVARTEASGGDVRGRPDIGVAVDRLLTGHLELKAPGAGSDAHRFRGRHAEQFERFSALPNLIYSDGRDWSLYRTGEQTSKVSLAFSPTTDGPEGVTDDDVLTLVSLLAQFFDWEPIAPRSPADLAVTLAPLTRLLRDEVLEDVIAGGDLAVLAGDWRRVFYPHASDRAFADAYAQTLTYALLMARLEGARAPLTCLEAANYLDEDHSLLAQVLRVLAQPNARSSIELPVELLERTISSVDGEALSRRGRDPWLYFYEDFLAEYDPEQRNNRGVFYTPLPVVRAQVRGCEDLLRTTFSVNDGLADERVTVLDPAAGTGTYPLEIVMRIAARVESELGPGMVPEILTQLAQNIYAFEILVGPYAVSHLRLTSALREAGATLSEGGAHVYLTDTLAAPVGADHVAAAPLFERPLAEEQLRASEVKARSSILCCIGNPPYDRDTSGSDTNRRKGGIVRHGIEGESGPLINSYVEPLPVEDRAHHGLQLYNDYVYFWRWASWKVFEQQPLQGGIVSFITASSYLTGAGFAGLREHLRRLCDEIWILDLGGEGRGARQEENVFDIRTPVAIAFAVRHPGNEEVLSDTPATVRYQRVSGSREEKYEWLDAFAELTAGEAWEDAPSEWQDPFVPEVGGLYQEWIGIDEIFPWSSRGIQFSRTWPVAEDHDLAERRWRTLVTAPLEDRPILLKESRDARVDRDYPSFTRSGDRLVPIEELNENAEPDAITPISYRSFDRRITVADRRVIDMPRPALWHSASDEQIYFTTLQENLSEGPVLVANPFVPDLNAFSNRGGITFPLWRDSDASDPNVTHNLLEVLAEQHERSITPSELAGYIYGLLGTPAFSGRYEQHLRHSGARVPITADSTLFNEVAELGGELVWWHTFGLRSLSNVTQRTADEFGPTLGSARYVVPVSQGLPAEFSYDPDTETLHVGDGQFAPVTPEQWAFSISGYQVVSGWLNARKAEPRGRTSSPLDQLRPASWHFAGELLELLHVIERTLELEPQAALLLHLIAEGDLIDASRLQGPTTAESTPPGPTHSSAVQLPLPGALEGEQLRVEDQ